MQGGILVAALVACVMSGADGAEENSVPAVPQLKIAAVERMPRLPEPMVVRDWARVSRNYYSLVLDPEAVLDGHRLVVVDRERGGFRMPTYLEMEPRDEAVTCLSAVLGAGLVGLDAATLHGIDWVDALGAWYDEGTGVYRSNRGRTSPVLHSGIYGYWPAILGMAVASGHQDDPVMASRLRATVGAFETIARGMGCPDNPDFAELGFNFKTGRRDGRDEPMNRLGHAPSIAWPLVAGAGLDRDRTAGRIACARAAMQWHIDHPGRYELTHVMGPLAAARLNAEHGCDLDMDAVMRIWFGDRNDGKERHRWMITSGVSYDGVTVDGLDGARRSPQGEAFYVFGMGSLHGPAWLVPVVRYDQRYARAIARYALHLANNARLFQGVGLDWERQDHPDWKKKWDPRNLLFYEALASWEWSDERKFRPYATGDPLRLGWGCERIERPDYLAKKKDGFSNSAHNLALYSGNHVGFLGGVCELTNVPGILSWDCLKTDWLHASAYPTRLVYNPHDAGKVVSLSMDGMADAYDLVSRKILDRGVGPEFRLTLAPDQVVVLVELPPGGDAEVIDGRFVVDGVTVDYRAR